MSTYRNILVYREQNYIYTMNLQTIEGFNFRIRIGSRKQDEYLNILKYVIDYVLDCKAEIWFDENVLNDI